MSATTVPSLIGGGWEEQGSDEIDPIYDPASGDTIAMLPYSTPAEIDLAVRAAKQAFPAWANTPVPDRAQVMFRFQATLEERFEELARLVTRENGKTLPESRGEVRRAIEVVELACGAPTLTMGTNLDQIAEGFGW
jgi:malonate-semialdehyde dehydrogenase (acetylating)/methylmalonate-semialdehyde dehydrogenase